MIQRLHSGTLSWTLAMLALACQTRPDSGNRVPDAPSSPEISAFVVGENRRAFEVDLDELTPTQRARFYVRVSPDSVLSSTGRPLDVVVVSFATIDHSEPTLDRSASRLLEIELEAQLRTTTLAHTRLRLEGDGAGFRQLRAPVQSTILDWPYLPRVALEGRLRTLRYDPAPVSALGLRNALALHDLGEFLGHWMIHYERAEGRSLLTLAPRDLTQATPPSPLDAVLGAFRRALALGLGAVLAGQGSPPQ